MQILSKISINKVCFVSFMIILSKFNPLKLTLRFLQ